MSPAARPGRRQRARGRGVDPRPAQRGARSRSASSASSSAPTCCGSPSRRSRRPTRGSVSRRRSTPARAAEKFRASSIEFQGGDPEGRGRPVAPAAAEDRRSRRSRPRSGFVRSIQTEKMGFLSIDIGCGRRKREDDDRFRGRLPRREDGRRPGREGRAARDPLSRRPARAAARLREGARGAVRDRRLAGRPAAARDRAALTAGVPSVRYFAGLDRDPVGDRVVVRRHVLPELEPGILREAGLLRPRAVLRVVLLRRQVLPAVVSA